MSHRIVRLCLAGLFVWGALSGCSNDSSTRPDHSQPNTPPAVPSASTMKPALDFYGIALPPVDEQSLAAGKPSGAMLQSAGDHSNFINAYVRALFVVLVTYDLLDEPIGAFAVSIHSVPQKLDDGSYLWTHIFVDNETDVEYSVFLYGTPGVETVAWRLEVSSDNPEEPLEHFVWFAGESRHDHTSGYWQFYSPVSESDGVEVVRVDWTRASKHEGTLELTVNGEGLANTGDRLIFTEGKHTSSIEFYDASTEVTSRIVWRANGTGSLQVPDYNGGEPACWDGHQVNFACE